MNNFKYVTISLVKDNNKTESTTEDLETLFLSHAYLSFAFNNPSIEKQNTSEENLSSKIKIHNQTIIKNILNKFDTEKMNEIIQNQKETKTSLTIIVSFLHLIAAYNIYENDDLLSKYENYGIKFQFKKSEYK